MPRVTGNGRSTGESKAKTKERVLAENESRANTLHPPGSEIARFPASLSNYQGYPKSGAMGMTFIVSFENIEKAWPLTRLTGLEFEVILVRPERSQMVEDGDGGEETDSVDGWDDLARRFE